MCQAKAEYIGLANENIGDQFMSRFSASAVELTNPLINSMKRALDAQDAAAAFPKNRIKKKSNVIQLPNLSSLRKEVEVLWSAASAGMNCSQVVTTLNDQDIPNCIDMELFNDCLRMTLKRLKDARSLLDRCGIASVSDLFTSGRNLSTQMSALGKLRLIARHADPKNWLVG